MSSKFHENLRENKQMLEELRHLCIENTFLINKVKSLEERVNTDNPKSIIMEIANDLLACKIKDTANLQRRE